MKTGVVVDASIWVANLVNKDVFNHLSRAWLERQHSQGIELLAPVFLLTEVAGVISRQTGEPELARRAVEALSSLPGLTLVRLSDTLVQDATRLATELGLRGADALYVAVADYLEVPLATFDQDQRQRASTILAEVIVPA